MDQNIVEIIHSLSALQGKIRQEGVDRTQQEIVDYLYENNVLIENFLQIYDTISESRRIDLLMEHRELDRTAVDMSFLKLARAPLKTVSFIISNPMYDRYLTITDDNLHMLKRALEFAKYGGK